MDTNTIGLVGGVVIIVVVFFAFRKKKNTQDILEQNNNIVPLMLQKSTQAKVVRLQHIIYGDAAAEEALQRLTADYKNGQINVHQYNDKLDKMLIRFDTSL